MHFESQVALDIMGIYRATARMYAARCQESGQPNARALDDQAALVWPRFDLAHPSGAEPLAAGIMERKASSDSW
jgi:hypothetical protein